jgi:hypothetical protein
MTRGPNHEDEPEIHGYETRTVSEGTVVFSCKGVKGKIIRGLPKTLSESPETPVNHSS